MIMMKVLTMSIEPPTEVTSTCTSTPHDIAKGLQDKPVQPCNHTFPKDKKSGRSFKSAYGFISICGWSTLCL